MHYQLDSVVELIKKIIYEMGIIFLNEVFCGAESDITALKMNGIFLSKNDLFVW